jgi:hypothetical protein
MKSDIIDGGGCVFVCDSNHDIRPDAAVLLRHSFLKKQEEETLLDAICKEGRRV